MAILDQHPFTHMSLTAMDYIICQAMCGSGVQTGSALITINELHRSIPCTPKKLAGGQCAAAPIFVTAHIATAIDLLQEAPIRPTALLEISASALLLMNDLIL